MAKSVCLLPLYFPADARSWSRIFTSSKGTTLQRHLLVNNGADSTCFGDQLTQRIRWLQLRRQSTRSALVSSCPVRMLQEVSIRHCRTWEGSLGTFPEYLSPLVVGSEPTWTRSDWDTCGYIMASYLVARLGASMSMGAVIPRYRRENLSIYQSISWKDISLANTDPSWRMIFWKQSNIPEYASAPVPFPVCSWTRVSAYGSAMHFIWSIEVRVSLDKQWALRGHTMGVHGWAREQWHVLTTSNGYITRICKRQYRCTAQIIRQYQGIPQKLLLRLPPQTGKWTEAAFLATFWEMTLRCRQRLGNLGVRTCRWIDYWRIMFNKDSMYREMRINNLCSRASMTRGRYKVYIEVERVRFGKKNTHSIGMQLCCRCSTALNPDPCRGKVPSRKLQPPLGLCFSKFPSPHKV